MCTLSPVWMHMYSCTVYTDTLMYWAPKTTHVQLYSVHGYAHVLSTICPFPSPIHVPDLWFLWHAWWHSLQHNWPLTTKMISHTESLSDTSSHLKITTGLKMQYDSLTSIRNVNVGTTSSKIGPTRERFQSGKNMSRILHSWISCNGVNCKLYNFPQPMLCRKQRTSL